MTKVAIALSGGVDSSYAAYLLKKKGLDVMAITMDVMSQDAYGGTTTFQQTDHAKRVADFLKIPHYTVDVRKEFSSLIVDRFCAAYQEGITPNPCIWCNPMIKFGIILQKAKDLGCDHIATGHYARIVKNKNSWALKKGKDPTKDQSYMLYRIPKERLKDILFPLGNHTKSEVKKKVRKLGIPASISKESQEICFIPDQDYPRFIEQYVRTKTKPGDIVDTSERVLGKHRGIIYYTIGQRRGLGISAKKPLYVLAINKYENRVVVGYKEEVYTDRLKAHSLNWIGIPKPNKSFRAKAKIRYSSKEGPALIIPLDTEKVEVLFDTPQMAITPGQSIVFYNRTTVLGGGEIAKQ